MSIKCAETHCNKTVHAENTFCLNHALGIDEARRVVQAMTLGCDHVYEPAPVMPRSKVFDGITIAIRQETGQDG
jgi:uncharacterized protein (DUF1800 family)